MHADAYKRNISVRRITHERSDFIALSLSLFREKNERENEKRITPGATITYCAI